MLYVWLIIISALILGFFDLKDLQSGEFRKLTPKEVAKVYGLKK